MSKAAEVVHGLFSPSPFGLAIGILLVLTVPLFLHFFVFRVSHLTSLPSIVLLGPSGSGKTSLLTLFERGQNAATHTSQVPLVVECSLPVGTTAASAKYRSANDPSNQTYKRFLLIDTPGHGKLRYHALEHIRNPRNLKGVVFLVDSANLSLGDEDLRQASEYLYDTLLLLQKRTAGSKTSKAPGEIPILIAANKMDLFTALPTALIKSTLEQEIAKIRISRSNGLLKSGVGMRDTVEDGEDDEWLGDVGSTVFEFAQMKEFNISVEIAGGSVLGSDNPDIGKWWNWVGERL